MRRVLLASGLLLAGYIGSAQTIVTTYAQYKSAVLEEFTGIHCVYCPDGHKRANEMKADFPGRVVLVNVHEGGYAIPNANEPDFRTPYGAAIAGQTGLTGYPSGTINRHVFPALNSSMALGRNQWRAAGEEIMAERSPLNLGATTTYNAATRTVTINVEGYYTMAGNGSYNLLNIALIQDSVVGTQTGAAANPAAVLPGGKYRHDHMLRDLVTGQWGDTIKNISAQSVYSKTFTYVLPDSINGIPVTPRHCQLAIYATEGRSNIIQGINIDIDGGLNDGNNAPFYGEFVNILSGVQAGVSGTPTSFSFDFKSATPVAQDFIFELSSNAPSNWSGNYVVGGNTHTGKATINVAALGTNAIVINVNPGADPAVAKYTLNVYPTSDTASITTMEVHVISGVKELIVNGTGAFGDGNTYNYVPDYLAAFATTASNTYAVTDADVMEMAISEQALGGVEDIYLNIGWTFPSFSDEQATALKSFITAGGNVFVAGQDMGWDINDPGGYGTAVTKDLYTNYFYAAYKKDGTAANNMLVAEDSDAIFGTVTTSSVVDKYAGNIYPDEIDPLNGGAAIFYYDNSKTKVAGIRNQQSNHKIVYLGIGLEMISDVTVRNKIIDLTYQWFKGQISTEEFDLLSQGFEMYPNPTLGEFTIAVPVDGSFDVSIINTAGTEISNYSGEVTSGTIKMDHANLPSGMYMVRVTFQNQTISKKLIVK
jgi:hypothetical protein